MTQTKTKAKAGGLKTKATLIAKFGPDYYKQIGRAGGSVKRRETRPFYINQELAREAGRKGGLKSKRVPVQKKPVQVEEELISTKVHTGWLHRMMSKLKETV